MEFLQLKVTDIIRYGKDAATIILQNTVNEKISYNAGQFLTFIFKHKDSELRRSYSLSSNPDIDKHLSVTVKRVVNGEISRYLLDHLQIGELLTTLPPAGKFTIKTNQDFERQFFFIAAGSGIVPVFTLIRQVLKDEPKSKILLVYQNHDEKQIIFENELKGLAGKHPTYFQIIYLFSKPESRSHLPERLTNNALEKIIEENILAERKILFFLCGHAAFMRMCLFTLKWMGFEEDQIKKENFTVEYVPPPPLITDTKPKKIIAGIYGHTFHFEVKYPDTILDAALKNNIQLPYSCRGGRCSTCTATCVSGKIKMSINEVLTEKDIQNGLVLTCVSYAETDVELMF
ncbi:MAG: iron-sulfur cluster-binding domain-containing protein [Bacteroidetes bacterium]|nr:iron-sulfur cluster-binding domain-containing protein [Bacteroidota bacterium]